MDIAEFAANYAQLGDDELLCLCVDRNALVPDAALALESEVQKRGLKTQDAARVKKRLDTLAARATKGPLLKQVAAAKYERNMRRFVGWEEPEFYAPYGSRDIRNVFAYIRHKYRVWKAFREHTGRWPVFSIWFDFFSWVAILSFTIAAFVWISKRNWGNGRSFVVVSACVLLLIGARAPGARRMRKLDWKKCGA